MEFPNGNILSAKVCQENNKALLNNPNKALGEWILQKVLNIPPRELVTYKKLEEIGIDSVEVVKTDEENFEINFKSLDAFEEFKETHLTV